ncbi:MAG TPA: hypothetical protein DCR40_11435 [Prolixibacteraceae bacterium]|nr:hypothetical protein [Prolixibacteraceae bacterium]
MKKQILIRTMVVMALMLSNTVFFTACQKTNETQTFNDVFNTSKIQTLNNLVENSSSLSDLPSEFQQIEIAVPEAIKNIQIADLIMTYEQNIKLSNSEIDLLLKNDIATYLDVIERISGLPAQIKALNLNFTEVKNSSLNKYLLVQKQEPDQYYLDDYYHSVIELQNYMKDFVIQPLRNFNALVEKSATLKSAMTKPDPTITYQLIVSNNNWDMWWTYTTVGKKIIKTKHKGAKGSFPG